MNPTLHIWQALGLDPAQYTPWCLMPLTVQRRAEALRSPVRDEQWLVVYPEPGTRHRDVVAGSRLQPQQARDAAEVISGRRSVDAWIEERRIISLIDL